MISIKDFCKKHGACRGGREWAAENCSDMRDVWTTIKPDWLVWTATREGVLTDKELRLFAVYCARSVQHLMTDPRSVAAIDVADRFANGKSSEEELSSARAAAAAAASASDAAWASALAAAAARAAARASARDAARASASDAAWASARDAAAARGAAWASARDAAAFGQAEWLRENTKPNFTGE